MVITKDQFKELFPVAKPGAYEALIKVMSENGITTLARVAAFLSQTGVESAGFSTYIENLNYSAERLPVIWPKHFTKETAKKYARKPDMIANKAYGGRMGNGPESSGEGWIYRGRGFIQCTGKDNYTKLGKSLGMTPLEASKFCETIEGAAASAAWYWTINNLNKFADKGDLPGLTKAINGGHHGLDTRISMNTKIVELIKVNFK